MRRGGFTMIELIFVIVILGILAAVALPKFIGVSEQAKEGKFKAFTGTLNRTVGPTVWSKAIAEGLNGKISDLNWTQTPLSTYVDLPKEIDETKVDMTKCDDQDHYKTVIIFDKNEAGADYAIACRDGSVAQAPQFKLYKTTTTVGLGVQADGNSTNFKEL